MDRYITGRFILIEQDEEIENEEGIAKSYCAIPSIFLNIISIIFIKA